MARKTFSEQRLAPAADVLLGAVALASREERLLLSGGEYWHWLPEHRGHSDAQGPRALPAAWRRSHYVVPTRASGLSLCDLGGLAVSLLP